MILLYWDIGKIIVESQKTKGYGKQVVEQLAGTDLQKEFPGMAGFFPQNVWFMCSFYLAWSAMPQKLSREYTFHDLKKPSGVAQLQSKLIESLPKNLKGIAFHIYIGT